MSKRLKWGRRKDDNRVAQKQSYALLQDVESYDIDDTLSIPEPDVKNNAPTELESNIDQPRQLSSTSGSQVFAFMGATGGVGTTSLATQLAHEFAVSSEQKIRGLRPVDPRVCLIDLDFETGACAHHLDLLPSLTHVDLSGPATAIDEAFTHALVSTHESGISLLAAPNIIGSNAHVNPRTVLAIIDAATELYDTVILDMPRHRQAWTLPIMQVVDVLGVTCELNIPSLHATREVLSQINQDTNNQVNAEVIIGKYERRSFKNKLKLSDVETALERNVFATICQDPDTIREALNCGEPAGALKSDSRFVKDVRMIAERLQNRSEKAAEKAA